MEARKEARAQSEKILRTVLGETSYSLVVYVPNAGGRLDSFVMRYAKTVGMNVGFECALLPGCPNTSWQSKFSGPMLVDLLTNNGCVAAVQGEDLVCFHPIGQETCDPGARKWLSQDKANQMVSMQMPPGSVPADEVLRKIALKAHLTLDLPKPGTTKAVLFYIRGAVLADVLDALARISKFEFNKTNIVYNGELVTSQTLRD